MRFDPYLRIIHIKSISAYLGSAVISLVLNIAVNPLIAINMSPQDYAVTGYYTSFNSLISPLITFYMIGYYLKEYYKLDETGRKRLYATVMKGLVYFSGIMSVICFLLLTIYLTLIKDDLEFPVMPYLALAVFSIPLTGIANLKLAHCRIVRDTKNFFIYSILTACPGIITGVFFVVALKWGAFGKLFAPFVCNLLLFLYLVYHNRQILGGPTDTARLKRIIIFSMPLVVGGMLEYFSGGFTNTYLESLGDTEEYGRYIVGSTIGAYMLTFSWAIFHTFQPDVYSCMANHNTRKLTRIIFLEMALISCAVILFALTSSWIIDILTAGRYVSSAGYARIIAVTAITSTIFYHINDYSIINNHPHLYLITTLTGGILIVIAMNVATRYFSYAGGAWVNVISYLMLGLINLFLISTIYRKPGHRTY